MANRKQTVAEILDIHHYSLLLARSLILPAADVDVTVRLEALGTGELSVVWLDGRGLADVPVAPSLVCVPYGQARLNGTAVFRDSATAGKFQHDVAYGGLPLAIQRWSGYADVSQCGDQMIVVMRDGGAVHEENIPHEYAARRKQELDKFFKGDNVSLTSVVEGYMSRAGRYSQRDGVRFASELQMMGQLLGSAGIAQAGAAVYLKRKS